ncbi:MAG: multidrug effflux MFS transporter [Rhodovibrionaceae bacterium]|nr:multidrug effflux MFS transporter [Rhodovibrionaceae bacterium]
MARPDSLIVVALLTELVALGPISTDLYLPSLPSLVSVFDADVASVQLTLSVFLAGFAVGQLVYGPLSDRFGRKPVMLAGLVIYLAASLLCALAGSIEALIAARFVQALGACVGPVLGRAVVRDVFGQARAATVLSYMGVAMALAPALGPILGGYLEIWFGWRSSFLALFAFALIGLAGVIALLPETNVWRDSRATGAAGLAANYRALLASRRYKGFLLVFASAYAGIFAFISGSSFVLIDTLKLAPNLYGLSFGAIVAGYMAGTLASGRLTERLGIERMVQVGIGFALAGSLTGVACAAAGLLSLAAVLAPVFVFMVGTGFMLPNAMAGAIGPFSRMAGTASSLLGFVQMILAAVVGVAVGRTTAETALPMSLAIAAMALLALAAYAGLVRRAPLPAE